MTSAIAWLVDRFYYFPKRQAEAMTVGTETDCHPASRLLSSVVQTLKSIFPLLVILLLVRNFLFESYMIPSASMLPTLGMGDHVIVNKLAYKSSRPSRGDTIVFKYPQAPWVNYIKRIVGLPGDVIDYRNKTLYINGAAQAISNPSLMSREFVDDHRKRIQWREALGDRSYSILNDTQMPDFSPGCYILRDGAISVPRSKYFVLGDNRDQSNDSRCWGLVHEKHLIGRAMAVWLTSSGGSLLPLTWKRLDHPST